MKGISFLILLILSSCATEPYDGVKAVNERLRQCFVESDTYQGKDAEVRGEMTAKLQVTPEGKISRCEIVKNDFKDPNFKTCVCDVFRMSVIPHDKKESFELIQPVNFYPAEQ